MSARNENRGAAAGLGGGAGGHAASAPGGDGGEGKAAVVWATGGVVGGVVVVVFFRSRLVRCVILRFPLRSFTSSTSSSSSSSLTTCAWRTEDANDEEEEDDDEDDEDDGGEGDDGAEGGAEWSGSECLRFLAGRARNSCCSSSWRCMSCCVSAGLGASSLCCLSRCQFEASSSSYYAAHHVSCRVSCVRHVRCVRCVVWGEVPSNDGIEHVIATGLSRWRRTSGSYGELAEAKLPLLLFLLQMREPLIHHPPTNIARHAHNQIKKLINYCNSRY